MTTNKIKVSCNRFNSLSNHSGCNTDITKTMVSITDFGWINQLQSHFIEK